MRAVPNGVAGLFLAAFARAPAQAASAPACAGPVEIARARIVRVEQNGALILSDGRALLLEGIRLPLAADKAPRATVDQARATLLTLARDGLVTGRAVPPKQDRYDRVRVQGFTATMWLQQALLEQGLARVSIASDREACAAELYRFEAQARGARRGIWASEAYRVRGNRDDWRLDLGTFQLIEGRVGRVMERDGRLLLDFGTDGRSGLLAVVAGEDRRSFRRFDPVSLEGRHVRVRGVVQDVGGRPQISLANPAQIEVLP
jgi:endonuclease YncB( thermonuclease family)